MKNLSKLLGTVLFIILLLGITGIMPKLMAVCLFIGILIFYILSSNKATEEDNAFLNKTLSEILSEAGCEDITFEPNRGYGLEVFTPCEFLPRCKYFNSEKMVTATWKGTPFRMAYGVLQNDGHDSQGDSTRDTLTHGRIIEISTQEKFPVWFGITHKKWTNKGVPFSGAMCEKANDYVVKMAKEEDISQISILDPYLASINQLIQEKEMVTFGFTEDKIYILLHGETVLDMDQKNAQEKIPAEIKDFLRTIEIMCQK